MSRADDLAQELDRARAENRELKARLAAAEHERDARARQLVNAIEHAQRLARALGGEATAQDAATLLLAVLLEDAHQAPNCAEWRGEYGGREFSVAVQWADGKSPHALIDEARAERDAARANAEHEANDVVALRAITEGRTTRPTDAEIDAHCASGGRWLMTAGHWNSWLFLSNHQQQAKNMREGVLDTQRWLPLDAHGRPCAWPVVNAPKAGEP